MATVANFKFSAKGKIPGRIVAIVGRNAVGKTFFLSQLASDLAQVERMSAERLEQRRERFAGEQPLFARVIAVSYSAFDRFRRPEATPYSSYVYCGIRDEKGSLSQRGLLGSYRRNRRRIREHDRESDWIDDIVTILGRDRGLDEGILEREIEDDEDGTSILMDTLSSGQAILCHLVTGLHAWLEPESIICSAAREPCRATRAFHSSDLSMR